MADETTIEQDAAALSRDGEFSALDQLAVADAEAARVDESTPNYEPDAALTVHSGGYAGHTATVLEARTNVLTEVMYYVRYDNGDEGWVLGSEVSPAAPAPAPAPAPQA